LTAANQSTTFQIDFVGNVDLSASGATVTFRACVASANGATTNLQAFAQNGADHGYMGHFQFISQLAAISSCPTMTDIPLSVAGGSLVASAVHSIGIQIVSDASAGPWTNPTVLDVDSITMTGNAAGPYDFTFNSEPFFVNVNAGAVVAGSTVGFTGSGGPGAAAAPGVAVLSSPLTAMNQASTFQIAFADTHDMSAANAMITFRLCVAAASGTTTNLLTYAQNDAANGFKSHYQYISTLSAISTCPTMQDIPMVVAGDTLVTNAVRYIGVQVASDASAGPWTNPTVIHVDSIAMTGNVVGPYNFASNSQPFDVNTSASIVGTSVGWSSTP